ncbi:putative RNA-binding Zn ribbon-like protein [Nonomuraea thailandensis]|uniref:RNA-binding Zn ribbon-like protein n=1 Tax=Nonomuraea thailandensis TaxID=1188745 RepID=A0A9X2GBV6_9ACTN|nr:CGNR zinc finger domain-containing protein [Nonomuraea thailandensis]MCP2354807.1 putative RNA-binding Zn ribbon-like protein [Nonomuraea thailandensis]
MNHVFLCGNPALDFACTVRARRTSRFETLDTPATLDSWYVECGLVDAAPSCQEGDLARAVAVREAIYALVTARLAGDGYDERALALVNEAARTPPATPQLTAGGRWTEATPEQALSTVARHAIELLSGPDVPLMKECANPECTKVFIDRSRGGRREWCGMESCGNKIKAAAYRARKKQAATAH